MRVRLGQSQTFERQAFDARLRIGNAFDTLSMDEVSILLTFTDAAGEPVLASSDPEHPDARFFVRVEWLDGIEDIAGSGSIAPASTADIHWLIVPAPGAAEDPGGTPYLVAALLQYRVGSRWEQIRVNPDAITVHAMPLLALDYFLPAEIHADIPATETVVEPSIPFTMGVRIRNDGIGAARRVSAESARIEVVENDLGLRIDFRILGAFINDAPEAPTLRLDFGDIAPDSAKVGRWVLATDLWGQFLEFSATFSHADALGGRLTSLVSSVETHELLRDVHVDLPGRDAIRDFLARDGDALRVYESNAVDTVVADLSGDSTLALVSTSGSAAIQSLSVPASAGMLFVQKPDPYDGTKEVVRVLRDDGKRLPAENVWFSKSGFGNDTEFFLNLFDTSRGGIYQIEVDTPLTGPQPPVLQFIPNWTVTAGERLEFVVTASDPDGTIPALGTGPLPVGAAFTDEGDGTGSFDWLTTVNQVGTYYVTFVASDGLLETSRTTRIDVILDLSTPTPSATPALSPSPTPTPTTTPTLTPTNTLTPTIPPGVTCEEFSFQSSASRADNGSTANWTWVGDILEQDCAATQCWLNDDACKLLYVSNLDTTGIPEGATIVGVELLMSEPWTVSAGGEYRDTLVSPVRQDGTIGAVNEARGLLTTSTACTGDVRPYGHTGFDWGETLCKDTGGNCGDAEAFNLGAPATGFVVEFTNTQTSGSPGNRLDYLKARICFEGEMITPTPTSTPTATPTPTDTPTATPTPTSTPTPPPDLVCQTVNFQAPVQNLAIAGAQRAWTSGSLPNVLVQDDNYTQTGATMNVDSYTDYLYLSNIDPAGLYDGMDVYGVELRYETIYSSFRDHDVRVVRDDGSLGVESRARIDAYPSTKTIVSRGAASDLWGENWCFASGGDCPEAGAINLAHPSTGFVIAQQRHASGVAIPRLYYAELVVCYTIDGGTPTPTVTPTPSATPTATATPSVTPTPPPDLVCETIQFRTPVANVELAGSSKPWLSFWLDRAIGSDDQWVTTGTVVPVGTYTDYLMWSNIDASDLDDGIHVYGILLHYEVQGGRFRDYDVRVRRSDLTMGSESRAEAEKYPATDAFVSRGASNDLWGEGWCVAVDGDCPDPSHVNLTDPNTGFLLSVYNTGSGSGSGYPWIDHAELEVCYTPPEPTPTPTPE